ncbi:MAG: DUF6064 family protein, partial [Bryobacteraceae bacterium]
MARWCLRARRVTQSLSLAPWRGCPTCSHPPDRLGRDGRQWLRRHESMNSSAVLALLAVQWAWSGIVYQWFFFRTANPAAGLFSAALVVQALCFVGLAVSCLPFDTAAP